MTKAERHYQTHKYDFTLRGDGDLSANIYCTTECASMLSDALATLGSTIDVCAEHPEFLGWTVEEIAEHLPEDAGPDFDTRDREG